MEGLIGLLIFIIVVGIVLGIVYYIITLLPFIIEPFRQIALAVLLLIGLLLILNRALPMLGVHW